MIRSFVNMSLLGRYKLPWGLRGSLRFGTTITTRTVNRPLKHFDPELFGFIEKEKSRQAKTVDLIASENFVPRYCSEALASCLSSRYSEGYPGSRYYAGNDIIDQVELLCQRRALKAFRLDESQWAVNVQALSGSPANFAVFNGLLNPGDRILFMDLPHGGHLSHGFHTPAKKLTSTSKYFCTMPYKLNADTELIDYDEIQLLADRFKPSVIIAGYSAYPRLLDYQRFRQIADSCGALLMSDVAHIAGLMAADLIPSAFDYSDVVTTTTHKTLRGPRGALIFMRKDKTVPRGTEDLPTAINGSVFPACQGGPHNHTIGAIAVALKAAAELEFKEYQTQVLKNAKALASRLNTTYKFDLVTGGTDNHLLLVNLINKRIKGRKVEKVLEECNIICNKNTVLQDKVPLNPSGIRLGTPAMTSRGFDEHDFERVADFINQAVEIACELPAKMNFQDYCQALKKDTRLSKLRGEVESFVEAFPQIESVIWNANESRRPAQLRLATA
eukprot:Blabericola_migrator_1__6791@NODE_3437_length_1777_cov_97_314035_g2137_i0_p1_GENE_NODE_3437_length_1777_cov_97_314035_g2137_i0NODE_3437_length_1777_cov_97_314035_g2137_i0_p1_ORF_typecomplete_len501_score74_07SHMT/PF00464_19/6_6e169Aminotran_5/PF00266_19/5_2e13Aminotran_1_2/PF00155_21/5_1e06OKR_DC_1/PF01276_20/3e05Beta_elim_lyase/PF01212_21/0_0034Cys_Met_Meta_PP/PF01053_20/0_0019_NODE_3437_length_1777_cov_97_314035_g2137_i01201622